MKTNLTLSSLLAAAIAGDVYLLSTGNTVEVTPAAPSGVVELSSDAAALILTDDSGALWPFQDGTQITCAPGGNLDGVWRDDMEWCTDGKGATWVRPAKGTETLEVYSGKVFSTRKE